MIRENMHIHSKYSWDSEQELEDIARVLASNNIKYGAITDHVEFEHEDVKSVIKKLEIRNKEIDRINEEYDGKIILLKGVEISEPHFYKNYVYELNKLDLDMVMGSIHKIDRTVKTDSEKKKAAIVYYNEILKMINSNLVDVIGHLDYINRYYGGDYSNYYQLREIYNALVATNTILEINTSASRRGCSQSTFPSHNILQTYRNRITDVTIGTDAHQNLELLDNLKMSEYSTKMLSLNPVIYKKRKRIRI